MVRAVHNTARMKEHLEFRIISDGHKVTLTEYDLLKMLWEIFGLFKQEEDYEGAEKLRDFLLAAIDRPNESAEDVFREIYGEDADPNSPIFIHLKDRTDNRDG